MGSGGDDTQAAVIGKHPSSTPPKDSTMKGAPSATTVDDLDEESSSISREDTYVADPLVGPTEILMAGFVLFGLALVWPPLILVCAYLISKLVPYCYRVTDDSSRRRQLLTKFEKEDHVSAHLRVIPTDVNMEQKYWTNSRGMLLHTFILTPKGQPIKAVVCFCHGYSDNPSYTRRRELARLVQHGIAVVVIDYEGHGRSDGTLGLVLDWDRLVDDAGTYFAQVSKTVFPEQKMFLMGESMGGAVAYCIYNNMPDVFSGVNFMSPMCKISDDMLPAQWIVDMARKVAGPTGEATKIGFLPISPARGDLKQYSFKLAYRRALYTRAPTAFGRNPRMATARELINTTMKISNSLSEFEAPFLVQHGSADRVTDPKLSQALYDEARSKDKTIRLYDGMWHCLMGGEPDENVDLVLQDSIDWILARAIDKDRKSR